ncbi:MAG: hypothetical protein LC737_06795 [Chloroflexi bacterium]|nr:hypothetical protein [Chloroflexota bacterium]
MNLFNQLDQLESAELIRRARLDTGLAYLFRHALVQDAAYNSLVKSDRRLLHRQVGTALEQASGSDDELAALLAHHFFAAEDWLRAARYSMRAGARALRMHAQHEAGDHYQQALRAWERVPDAPASDVIDALLGWSQAAFKYKPFPQVLEQLAQAEQMARALHDTRRLVEVLSAITKVHLTSGYATRGVPMAVEAYALARELGDERLMLTPACLSAYARIDLDPRGTVTHLNDTVALARKYGELQDEAYALGIKAMACARLGQFAQSEHAIRQALDIVSILDSPFADSDAHLFAGWSYLDMGDAQRALAYGQQGVAKAMAAENMDCICFGFACVGFGNLQARNVHAARASFEEAVRRSHASGAAPIEGIGRAGLAITKFLGRETQDVSEIERALAQSRAGGNPFMAAQLSQALGEIMLLAGQLAQAEHYLGEALAYYRPNKMQPYIARTLETLAQVNAQQGRAADAEQARAESERAWAACERV